MVDQDFKISTNSDSSSGNITITDGSNGNITIAPNGSGSIVVGNGGANATITSNGGFLSFNIEYKQWNKSGTMTFTDGANGNIAIVPNGSGKVLLDGDGSSGGILVSDGLIDMLTGTGSVSKIKFYCESSNAHAQTLQAQPHSDSVVRC